MNFFDISLDDYDYVLPNENIALHPSTKRDECKLLVYNVNNNNDIIHTQFKHISNYLSHNSTLIMNSTKVLPARILMNKPTGAAIEFLLLNPADKPIEFQLAMALKESATWECIIGGKNIKLGAKFDYVSNNLILTSEILKRWDNKAEVKFTWQPSNLTFSEVLNIIGNIPLPPYLHRSAVAKDKQDYQTIYANYDGSVAAPTAGLHFTEEALSRIKDKSVKIQELVLHIGAGTFVPITTSVAEHKMHSEQLRVSKEVIANLLESYTNKRQVIATGTTSLRTLESLYWFANQLYYKEIDWNNYSKYQYFNVTQQYSYCLQNKKIDIVDAFTVLLEFMERNKLNFLAGTTSLFIVPQYEISTINGLITNFHLPKSTLLLLVSALIGTKNCKNIYQNALLTNYKFLSYGDASLLFKERL